MRRHTDTDRINEQTQTLCVIRGVLLGLGVVGPAVRRVAMRSVGTSDVEITSGALHRDDKAFQALQLHFGGLSCVDAMESCGSDSTFDEEETQREFDEAIAGDDYYDDYGHDESVFDTFDDHLTYG